MIPGIIGVFARCGLFDASGVRCSVFRNSPDGVSFWNPALSRPISKNRTPDPCPSENHVLEKRNVEQKPTSIETSSKGVNISHADSGLTVDLLLLLLRAGLKSVARFRFTIQQIQG
jgi:hypothetical protein